MERSTSAFCGQHLPEAAGTNQAAADDFPDTALSLEVALRRFVAAELWHAYEEAAARRRALPKKNIRLSEFMHGSRAIAANQIAAQARNAKAVLKQASQRILLELRSQLLAGKLTAYVRESFPFGPVRPVPPDAWKNLQIANVSSGCVKGPGMELTGLRIAPGTFCQSWPAEASPQPDTSLPADTPGSSETAATEFSHNDDFSIVRLGSAEFHFGIMQAAVVKQLHEASKTPEPWCSGKVLLDIARSKSRSLSDIFRRHTNPSWQLLIEYRHNGKYRLRPTDAAQ